MRTRLLLVAGLLLILALPEPAEVGAFDREFSHAEILQAIRMVESGGREPTPDGDGGLAIGPYQIHWRYWCDSGVKGQYQDCRNRAYAERVVTAYMQRWVPDAWYRRDPEVIARTHNGGPRGVHKTATDRYWARVAAELRELPD